MYECFVINLAVDDDNFSTLILTTTSSIVEDDLASTDEYLTEKVNEVAVDMKEEEINEEHREQDEDKMTTKGKENLEVKDEEK